MAGARSSITDRLQVIAISLAVAISGFVAGLAVLIILVSLLAGFGYGLEPPDQLFLSLIALQGIGFPLVAFAYLRIRNLPPGFIRVTRPSLRGIGLIVLGWIGALVAANVAAIAVTQIVPTPASNEAAEIAFEHPEVIPYLIPLVFLLNGPGEELLFRGVIQGTLRERFGPIAAIVLASLLFSPAHITALLGAPLSATLATMAILLVPSFVFGALYEYSGNLVVPAVVHGLYNATLFGALYLVATNEDLLSGAALLT